MLFAAFESAALRKAIVPIGYIAFMLLRIVALETSDQSGKVPSSSTFSNVSPPLQPLALATTHSASVDPHASTSNAPPVQFPDCPTSWKRVAGAFAPPIACSPQKWIASDDYPVAALRRQAEGKVAIVGVVGSQGRLIACTVESSSGDADLDLATCSLLQKRARFIPARDARGRSIDSMWKTRVSWQLPR